ncbi:MAG: pyridoxamine 5-phosphate oxidase-related, FMN-binding protein [Caulobacteraceae bacterium]|nr:pyridoxamine 5-phosphate oxidase-related, FMN-binding protein [Caulobacteraceae bacterium]
MSKVYEVLDDRLKAFIAAQKMFFVGTAPLSGEGLVNLSPKGYDSLKIIDDLTVAYCDLGGSGVETLAHVRENERITLMFCAFEGAANILRLYGRGEAVTVGEPGFEEAMAMFPNFDRARAVITVHITRIADSCGWAVPFYEFKGEREQLRRWMADRTEEEWLERRYATNATSLDGLTGLVRPQ